MPAPAAARQAVSGALIASDALRYVGKGYVFGGNASSPGDWDCSSFVSYVLGHDLGLALPGGRWGDPGFPPTAHGPVVTSYASWAGAAPVDGSQAGAGDLVCWVGIGAGGHIGIVLGPDKMVSALNSQQGTAVTPITGAGPIGVPQVYRRVLAASGGAPAPASATGGTAAALMAGLLIVGAMAAAVVALAALAGMAAVLAGTWLAGKTAEGG